MLPLARDWPCKADRLLTVVSNRSASLPLDPEGVGQRRGDFTDELGLELAALPVDRDVCLSKTRSSLMRPLGLAHYLVRPYSTKPGVLFHVIIFKIRYIFMLNFS